MSEACGIQMWRRAPSAEGVRCEACGIRLAADGEGVLRPEAREAAPDYPEDGNARFFALEERSFWFRHRNEVIRALVERLPPGGPLWDVGGGNGFQAVALARAGIPTVLVEPGPAGCRNARRRGAEVVVLASLEGLGLPDAHLGGVSFFDVLEHLDDPGAILREARRVLAPGGRVYVTVPAYRALWSEADDYAEHKTRYTASRLTALLEGAGLAAEYVSYYFQPLVVPIFLLRSVPSAMRRLAGRAAPRVGEDEHQGDGLAARAVEALLARERAHLASGGRQAFGASLIAVARA